MLGVMRHPLRARWSRSPSRSRRSRPSSSASRATTTCSGCGDMPMPPSPLPCPPHACIALLCRSLSSARSLRASSGGWRSGRRSSRCGVALEPSRRGAGSCTLVLSSQVLLPLKSQLRSAEKEAAAARDEAARLATANEEMRVELERCRAMNRVLAQKTTDAEVEAAVERARATEEATAERAAATTASGAVAPHLEDLAAAPAPLLLSQQHQQPTPAGKGMLRGASLRSVTSPPAPGGRLPQLTTQPSFKQQLAVTVKGAPPLGWGVTVADRIVQPAGPPQLPPNGDFLCARCNASVAEVMAQDAAAAAAARSKNPFAAQVRSIENGGNKVSPHLPPSGLLAFGCSPPPPEVARAAPTSRCRGWPRQPRVTWPMGGQAGRARRRTSRASSTASCSRRSRPSRPTSSRRSRRRPTRCSARSPRRTWLVSTP